MCAHKSSKISIRRAWIVSSCRASLDFELNFAPLVTTFITVQSSTKTIGDTQHLVHGQFIKVLLNLASFFFPRWSRARWQLFLSGCLRAIRIVFNWFYLELEMGQHLHQSQIPNIKRKHDVFNGFGWTRTVSHDSGIADLRFGEDGDDWGVEVGHKYSDQDYRKNTTLDTFIARLTFAP